MTLEPDPHKEVQHTIFGWVLRLRESARAYGAISAAGPRRLKAVQLEGHFVMPTDPRGKQVAFFCLLLVLSGTVNIALTLRNQSLKEKVRLLESPRPRPGEAVPAMNFRTSSGAPLQITFPRERPVLLYSVRPDCGWCDRNAPMFTQLLEAARSSHDIVVVERAPRTPLSEELIEAYRMSYSSLPGNLTPTLEPLTIDSEDLKSALGGTPQTILVDESGKVAHNWLGAYQDGLAETINSIFPANLDQAQ